MNRNRRVANDLSQADFTWARSGYGLKTKPSHTGSWLEVTLIIFSVAVGLGARERFAAFARNTTWQDILEDPYCLLNVAFEGLYDRVDKLAWDFAHVYGQEEDARFSNALSVSNSTDKIPEDP